MKTWIRDMNNKKRTSDTFYWTKHILPILRNENPPVIDDEIMVVLDKDCKRRCVMSSSGYAYRLKKGFVDDHKFYSVRYTISKTQLASERKANFRSRMDERWWPEKRPFQPMKFAECILPTAYHTYKSKYIKNPTNSLVGFCEKQHAHEREIISCAGDPAAVALKYCSRALRLLVRYQKPYGWTLWRQIDIVPVIREKVKKLRYRPGLERVCVCGRQKLPVEGISADAAQFF